MRPSKRIADAAALALIWPRRFAGIGEVAMILLAAALAVMVGDARPMRFSAARRDRIARRCHVPTTWLPLREGGRLHFRPPASARYRRVDCVLRAITPRDAPPHVFIGNEEP
jgi:hypothetical protein